METVLQQLINGLTLGSIYGLIAIGYTMVYGIIGMINFAHGDIFMVGAFISLIAILAIGITASASFALLLLALGLFPVLDRDLGDAEVLRHNTDGQKPLTSCELRCRR